MKKVFLILTLALLSTSVSAETLMLKSGQVIEGIIVNQTEEELKIDTGIGVPVTYYMDEIANISGASTDVLSAEYSAGIFSNGKAESTLMKSLQFYFKAIDQAAKDGNIDILEPYIKPEQFEVMKTLPKEQMAETLKWMKGAMPQDGAVINEIIEGDKGVLIIEGFENPEGFIAAGISLEGVLPPGYTKYEKRPIKARAYQINYFENKNNRWNMVRSENLSYFDPRPAYVSTDGSDIKYIGMQFHCNFIKDVNDCADPDKHPMQDECYKCMAQLKIDPDLCQMVAKELEAQDAEFFAETVEQQRQQCFESVAHLSGDVALCQKLSEEGLFVNNPRKDCMDSLRFHDWLGSQNVYTIDSDEDGLTDRLEMYFNTSKSESDTDGDGQSDKMEIENFTNPLGDGRLGDHLSY